MGLFDRIVNLARGKAKVWARERRDAETPEAEADGEEATPRPSPRDDPEDEPPEDPHGPPDEPPLPRKKRL